MQQQQNTTAKAPKKNAPTKKAAATQESAEWNENEGTKTEAASHQLSDEPAVKRSQKTTIFAFVTAKRLAEDGEIHELNSTVEAEGYQELREKLEALGEVHVNMIIRGRRIPFKAKASIKFF